jgi:hypothetical protein
LDIFQQGNIQKAMEKGNEAMDKTSDKVSYMANKSKQYT